MKEEKISEYLYLQLTLKHCIRSCMVIYMYYSNTNTKKLFNIQETLDLDNNYGMVKSAKIRHREVHV